MLVSGTTEVQGELELPTAGADRRTRWFSDGGSVVEDGDDRLVFVRGVLVGRFEVGDAGGRNVLLVNLLAGGQHVGRLARAFGISESTVYNIRKRYEEGGLEALVRVHAPKPPRRRPRLSGRERRQIERLFEQGNRVPDILEEVEKKYGVKRTVLYEVQRAWRARRRAEKQQAEVGEATVSAEAQRELELPRDSSVGEKHEPGDEGVVRAPVATAESVDGAPVDDQEGEVASETGEETNEEPSEDIGDAPLEVGTTRNVQHAGTWLMMAMLVSLGLYDVLARVMKAKGISHGGMRLAVDAFVAALSIRERCVEGVRRLATPTASVLLRAQRAPSAPWVRSMLAKLSTAHTDVQDAMTKLYLAVAASKDMAVFYVDNHLRPYTGKFTVRRGWRMQDKRVVPGTSDYYVHDLDGRPVLRITEPSHGHLTEFLRSIADTLRRALGVGTQIVLAFDRGGAFPAAMSKLRDAGVHFVTYERKPYAIVPSTMFEPEGIVRIGKNVYTIYENRLANLGKERGRVRRIAVLCPDGRQVNLLAVSDLPAHTLLEIMLGRWKQENGFKHGNERWGINQLDGRRVLNYAPDTVIPNPARRRLDNALRIARRAEGDARCKLAKLSSDDPRRSKYEQQIHDALANQRILLDQRPHLPKHVELRDSELADELVHHTLEYKGLLDAVRIACANAESDCVARLGRLLPREQEAKKVLANLLTAPGDVRVNKTTIRITLAPAATNGEREALDAFVHNLDDLNLTLPADPDRRRLRFRLQD